MTDARNARTSVRVARQNPNPNVLYQRLLARQSVRVARSAGTAPIPTVNAWDGSAFVAKPVRFWNGTTFDVAIKVRTWDGSAWV
jgi:hypothetical protein